MKLAVIGGGSTYTPELADGIGRLLPQVTDFVLVDPDPDRLAAVGPVSARIMAAHDHPGDVSWTDIVDEGTEGADAILFQLRIGGQAARQRDETWPLDCGCVGQETTGAGGLAKALRTVPVVLDVAARADPDAWIIDFTNPVGIVTRALLDAGHRAVGLCNVAIGFQRRFARMLDVAPSSVVLDHVGLNHLTWERAAYVDGVDRLPSLLAAHLDELAADVAIPRPVLEALGCVPSYYLRYFYSHDLVVREERGAPTRGQRVAEIEAELLSMYRDVSVTTKPELLGQRGGAFYSEAAVGLIASLAGLDPAGVHSVNVRNNGTRPFLPAEAVIEVSAHADASVPAPLKVAPVAPDLAGLIGHVSGYEELAVDAALRGGRQRVYRTLLAHPLIGQPSAARLSDEHIVPRDRRRQLEDGRGARNGRR